MHRQQLHKLWLCSRYHVYEPFLPGPRFLKIAVDANMWSEQNDDITVLWSVTTERGRTFGLASKWETTKTRECEHLAISVHIVRGDICSVMVDLIRARRISIKSVGLLKAQVLESLKGLCLNILAFHGVWEVLLNCVHCSFCLDAIFMSLQSCLVHLKSYDFNKFNFVKDFREFKEVMIL